MRTVSSCLAAALVCLATWAALGLEIPPPESGAKAPGAGLDAMKAEKRAELKGEEVEGFIFAVKRRIPEVLMFDKRADLKYQPLEPEASFTDRIVEDGKGKALPSPPK